MAAQVDLETEPFWTKWFLKLIFGQYPQNWSLAAHSATGWKYWDQPSGERVDCWKYRVPRSARAFTAERAWPKATGKRPEGVVEVPIHTQRITFNVNLWEGSYSGEPLQMGAPNKFRQLSYGYIVHGDKKFAMIPLPAVGRYFHCGDPTVASDRHVALMDPVTGEVHETIQFDENAPESAVTNQALGYTRWKNGIKLEGGKSNATDTPMHGFMWGFGSSENPHALGLTLPDYVGADGSLLTGPEAGSWCYLPADSESYKAMVALGGECAAIAKAANEHGLKIVDRSGYKDSPNTAVGTQLLPSAIWIQWGSGWRKTNIGKLDIPLTDLRVLA